MLKKRSEKVIEKEEDVPAAEKLERAETGEKMELSDAELEQMRISVNFMKQKIEVRCIQVFANCLGWSRRGYG